MSVAHRGEDAGRFLARRVGEPLTPQVLLAHGEIVEGHRVDRDFVEHLAHLLDALRVASGVERGHSPRVDLLEEIRLGSDVRPLRDARLERPRGRIRELLADDDVLLGEGRRLQDDPGAISRLLKRCTELGEGLEALCLHLGESAKHDVVDRRLEFPRSR